MIDKLFLNKRYFRSKAGRTILPEHLDSQFNNIANYINNDLIPYVESINFDATNGEAGYPFAVFCNINNDDVGYQYLNNVNIDDNLLSLNKLSKVAAGSILGSNIAGNVITITPTDTDQLIFLGDTNPEDLFDLPGDIHFRKIKSEDIVNNSLTGQQIAVVANDNFAPGTFINLIPDNSLLANNLRDVKNNNIALAEVDFRHIGVFSNLPYNVNIATQVLLGDFDDNSITADKVQDGTIGWVNFTVPQPINAVNLLNGFIRDAHFKPYIFNTQPPLVPNTANLIASNFNAIVNFTHAGVQVYNNMQLTADKITLNCLSATNFTQDIQNAIVKYQQIKNQIILPPIQVKKTEPKDVIFFGVNDYKGYSLSLKLYAPFLIGIDPQPTKYGTYFWYVAAGKGNYDGRFNLIIRRTEAVYTVSKNAPFSKENLGGAVFTFDPRVALTQSGTLKLLAEKYPLAYFVEDNQEGKKVYAEFYDFYSFDKSLAYL